MFTGSVTVTAWKAFQPNGQLCTNSVSHLPFKLSHLAVHTSKAVHINLTVVHLAAQRNIE